MENGNVFGCSFFFLFNLVGNKKKLCMWFPYVLKSFPLAQKVPVQIARRRKMEALLTQLPTVDG